MPNSIPLDFYLDWIICAQFAGLCWAVDKGLYEAAGLDVHLIPWADDGRSVIDKVNHSAADGRFSLGSCEDNLIVIRIAQDRSIKVLGAMLQEPPLVLMSHVDSGITRIADLVGKRVGMHTDGIVVLKTILAVEGIDEPSIDITEVGFDLDHLIHRRFDALQGYHMTEPVQLAQLGLDVSVLPVSHHRLKPYAQVYFSSAAQIDENKTRFSQFRSASDDGWRGVLNDPDEAAHVVARMMGDPGLAPQQRLMLGRLLPLIAGGLRSNQIGSIDVEQWDRNLTTYIEFGIIDRPLNINEVVHFL